MPFGAKKVAELIRAQVPRPENPVIVPAIKAPRFFRTKILGSISPATVPYTVCPMGLLPKAVSSTPTSVDQFRDLDDTERLALNHFDIWDFWHWWDSLVEEEIEEAMNMIWGPR